MPVGKNAIPWGPRDQVGRGESAWGEDKVGAHLASRTARPPHLAGWPHRSWCSPAHSGGGPNVWL